MRWFKTGKYKIIKYASGYQVHKNYGLIFNDWYSLNPTFETLEAAENYLNTWKSFDNPEVVKVYD